MAVPVFCCGFECGVFATTSPRHWASNGSPAFSTSTVRSGSRSLRCNAVAALCNAVTSLTTSARWIGRFYVYFASLPNANCSIASYLGNDTGPNVRFNSSDNKLYAAVSTTIGASGVLVTTGVWYRIDFDFNCNVAGADFCDVQVEGVVCDQATATGASSSATSISMGFISSVTADAFFEDVIFSNTAADYPLGPGYVNHFIPVSDGTHNVAGAGDFQRTTTGTDILNSTTTAYQLIDDVPLESGASVDWINLVAPANAGDYVEVNIGPAPGIYVPISPPRAVDVIIGIHQAGTGTGNMEVRFGLSNFHALYTATTVAGSTTVVYKRTHYKGNPDPVNSGTSWTLSEFNNIKLRFGSPAALDANPDQYLDCVMVEAEFVDQLNAAAFGRPMGQLGQNLMQQLLAT